MPLPPLRDLATGEPRPYIYAPEPLPPGLDDDGWVWVRMTAMARLSHAIFASGCDTLGDSDIRAYEARCHTSIAHYRYSQELTARVRGAYHHLPILAGLVTTRTYPAASRNPETWR